MKDFLNKFNVQLTIAVTELAHEFYEEPREVTQVRRKIKNMPVFSGSYLGRYKKNKFKPSPYLLEKIKYATSKKLVVNEKAEWLFICGRDIHGKNILKSCDAKEDEYVLILNGLNECLGYARVSKIHNGEIKMIKNIFDIGDFLRRE